MHQRCYFTSLLATIDVIRCATSPEVVLNDTPVELRLLSRHPRYADVPAVPSRWPLLLRLLHTAFLWAHVQSMDPTSGRRLLFCNSPASQPRTGQSCPGYTRTFLASVRGSAPWPARLSPSCALQALVKPHTAGSGGLRVAAVHRWSATRWGMGGATNCKPPFPGSFSAGEAAH